MLSLPLDVLLFFTVTTPLWVWLTSRTRRGFLCGVYPAVGLAVSGVTLYSTFIQVSSASSMVAQDVGLFSPNLRIDVAGVFMAAVFLILGLFVVVYSVGYMEKDSGKPLYFSLLLAMISGMIGVVFAGDLFTLYVFWELMSVSSYVLVAFRKDEWEPVEAGFKYLVMGVAGSASALFGMSLLYGLAGTLDFQGLTSAFSTAQSNQWLDLALLFILVGFGVKAAIVPLHTWLPDAHSAAPTPVSAMLSGVVVATGVFALLRTFSTAFVSIQVQWFPLLAILSVATMILGNLTALLQEDLKRLLAYSTIGHVGYMLVGLSIFTQIGVTGTFLHVFNHALMKGCAFLCAGAFIYRLETRKLADMTGIGRKMPITTLCLAVSLFALMGMPPLNGFVSELTLFTASAQANVAWLGVAIILNSILSAAYYLRILRTLIQPRMDARFLAVKEAPISMLLPIGVMTVALIVFGIYPEPVIRIAQQAANGILGLGP